MIEAPFFSNDWLGVLKLLIAVVAPISGLVITALWKFISRDLKNEIDEVKNDVNGLGTRVGSVETTHHKDFTSLDTRMDNVEKARLADDQKFSQLFLLTGELKQSVTELKDVSTDGKMEIIGHIHEMQQQLSDKISASSVEVANLGGQVKAFRDVTMMLAKGRLPGSDQS